MSVSGVGTMIHIDDLPEELLLKVFSNLPVWDLVRISRVCHRWNRVSRDRWLWEHVDLTTCSIQPRMMWHLLCCYMAPHLQSLRLSGYIYTGLSLWELTPSLMQGLSDKCPKLRHLSLHALDMRFLPLCTLPSTLRSLELHDCKMTEEWMVTSHEAHLPPLESLVVKRTPDFCNHLLKDLSRLPFLHSRAVVCTCAQTAHGLDNCLRELQDLREQHGLPRIETGNWFLCAESIGSIVAQNLNRLRSLYVGIRNLSVICLKHLSALPELESLTVVDTEQTSQIPNPQELLATLLDMPKLRSLEIIKKSWGNNQEEVKEVLSEGLPHCKVVLSNWEGADNMNQLT